MTPPDASDPNHRCGPTPLLSLDQCRQIAAEFDISVARVGQIMTGVTNPRTQKNPPPKKRPRKKPDEPSAE